MVEPTLTTRVEILERNVGNLQGLPARVEAVELQIVQLRAEMRGEFSAVRQEMAAMGKELREEIRGGDAETRRQMQSMRNELISKIEEGDEETRRHMRVLHEEVIATIKTLGATRGKRARK